MYLICYDISSNKYRKKVADTLLNYGKRVQYSVFECTLDKAKYRRLYSELELIVKQCGEKINIRIFAIRKEDYAKTSILGIPDFILEDPEETIVI